MKNWFAVEVGIYLFGILIDDLSVHGRPSRCEFFSKVTFDAEHELCSTVMLSSLSLSVEQAGIWLVLHKDLTVRIDSYVSL